MTCLVEWTDLAGVEHGCIRCDAKHKREHRCGCGATLPRDAQPPAIPSASVCLPSSAGAS